MFGSNYKISIEKIIILISIVALFGVVGISFYKLISIRDIRDSKEDSFVSFRVLADNKYGLIDENGEEIVPCIYKAIGPFSEGMAVAVDNSGRYGYLRSDGKLFIPCQFERAYKFTNGLGRVRFNGKYYYINKNGKLSKQGFDYIEGYSEGLARIYQGGKFGFIDEAGKAITPIVYDFAWDFEAGFAIVIVGRDMYLIDKEGKRRTYEDYDSIWMVAKGFIAKKKGKYGFIDYNNERVVLDFKYDYIYPVPDYSGDESWLYVKIDDKYGAYDYKGNCLIPPLYDEIDTYLGRFPSVCIKDGRYGFAQSPDSFHYDDIDPLNQGSERVYIVKEGGLYGVLGKEGTVIIPTEYKPMIHEKDDGVYYEYVNEKGDVVSAFSFEDFDDCEEGLYPFEIDDKYGYINKNGKVVIEAQYDYADDFCEGYAVVELNGKYGYVDTTGKLVSGFRYDYARDFERGRAWVQIGDGEWLIDSKCELLTKRPYFYIINHFRANSDSFQDVKDVVLGVEYDIISIDVKSGAPVGVEIP